MKTTPLPEVLAKANLGNLYADSAHSIINPPQAGIDPQSRDLVATVFDCNLGHERAAASAALLSHAANVLPGLVEAAGDIINHLDTPQSARLTNMADLLESLRQALSLATNVPVNS